MWSKTASRNRTHKPHAERHPVPAIALRIDRVGGFFRDDMAGLRAAASRGTWPALLVGGTVCRAGGDLGAVDHCTVRRGVGLGSAEEHLRSGLDRHPAPSRL